MAKFCNCSEWKVSTSIKKLSELGYIEIVGFNGKYRTIKSRLWKIPNQACEKPKADLGKPKTINITNNIDNNIYTSTTKEDSLIDYVEKNFMRTLSPIEYEHIKQWKDTELVRYVIKNAVLNQKYNIHYINKVLYEMEKQRITTVQEAQVKEQEFQEKKRNKQSTHYKTRYEREQEAIAKFLEEDE